MNRALGKSLKHYAGLLLEIKTRIRSSQNRAAQAVNTELLRLYWDIGRLILARQSAQGWGASVIPRLARDLHNELPAIEELSERNINLMIQFAGEYPTLFSISQPLVAKLPADIDQRAISLVSPEKFEAPTSLNSISQPLVAQLPWAHNVLLIQSVKDLSTRIWYMRQALQHGWSRNVLSLMIGNKSHLRQGRAVSNFQQRLAPAQSDLAIQLLKDPYIFDFLTLQEPFHERELETTLLRHLQQFLLELGRGFAFVGSQYHVQVDDKDFYIDLLFYHLSLRCFVVIDLKVGDFEAEHAGKMNFYLNVLDDKLRHPSDKPSIGLILCQKRNRVIAEYALRGFEQPIGISQYELTRALPSGLKSSLPTIQQIEAEFASQKTSKALTGNHCPPFKRLPPPASRPKSRAGRRRRP